MRIVVREAKLPSEKAIFVNTLARYLTPLSDERRFDWLYMKGPHGPARGWVATDEQRNSVIGVAGAFPRLVWMNGKTTLAWVLGDFCLDSAYRSLGPALQLQRACLSMVEGNESAFCYDFPSASMVAVYKRLGSSVTGQMVRLAKPLRVDRKIKEMIQNRTAQHVVSSVANAFLKICSPRAKTDNTLETSIQRGSYGEEFTTLANDQCGKLALCLQRSAEYLNWRYVNNSLARHEIITARRDGRLVGYVVWTHTGKDAYIVDLFGEDDLGMVRRLVAEVTALARERGMMTLSVSLNESHPWKSLFSEVGFHLRDSAPLMIIPSKTFAQKIDPQLTGWYLMQGDRDS
jgi:hypothetical protein